LIPFFEPVLQKLNNTVFDAELFAKAIRHLYGWHFTKDIAEDLIPRLVRRKYLEKHGTLKSPLYRVTCEASANVSKSTDQDVSDILETITKEFGHFSETITDVTSVERDP